MGNRMMDFQEFTEAVLEEIRKKADGSFDVLIRDTIKNNDVKITGIYAVARDSDIGPCVYLDEFYKEYEDGGMELGESVDEIYRLVTKYLNNVPDVDVSCFLSWEPVQSNIYAKLVNAKQNKLQLETIPHRMFLDLAVVYYAVVRDKEQEIGTILIRNEHMKSWDQDEETLYQTAMCNMRADGEANFVSMETMLKQIYSDADIPLDVRECNTGMYILTNSRKKFGASEILDKSTLRMIADKLGDEFIVLPSSIHETIVLPSRMGTGYGSLADMVREVNDTEVMEEERLSYHVYVYSRDEDTLQIAA